MRKTVTRPTPRWPVYEDAQKAAESVEPLNNRVMVRRLKPDDEKHGILLANQPKAHFGEVLAKGPGKKLKSGYGPMEFEVGDIVLLGSYDDYPYLTAGEDVIMVREGDILAVADGA